MSIAQQQAYLDEFGNSGLDFTKEQISSHFIVTSIIVDESKVTDIEKKLEIIRKKYFQTGEMKSSTVAQNHSRRLKILQEVVELDFHIYSIVVDKTKLTSEGFGYKSSFYKFLHTLVDKELFIAFPNIRLIADEYGRTEFMEGFIKYVKDRHIPTLFDAAEFRFEKSQSELLIQLADFISGTIARHFDKTVYTVEGKKFIDLLRATNKVIGIVNWPKEYKPYVYETKALSSSTFDQLIANQCLALAYDFLEKSPNKRKPFSKEQESCLRFLLFNYNYIDPEKYVRAPDIIRHLEVGRPARLTVHQFRSKVIAKLRDAGVIISTSNLGYKIPANEADIFNYVNQVSRNIRPMLDRVKSCREQFLLATKNSFDVLDKPEYDYLKTFFQ